MSERRKSSIMRPIWLKSKFWGQVAVGKVYICRLCFLSCWRYYFIIWRIICELLSTENRKISYTIIYIPLKWYFMKFCCNETNMSVKKEIWREIDIKDIVAIHCYYDRNKYQEHYQQ